MFNRIESRIKRKTRIRKDIVGSAELPRLTVYRSNKHIYAQLIDDISHATLASASDAKTKSGTPIESAKAVGAELAKLALKKNIEKVVFDRNGYKFHGRVKSLADGAREGGLKF